jgi:hypothetical protein
MSDALRPEEQRELLRAFARASEQGWGIAVGLTAALGLWFATVVLVVRGGDVVGPHLGLLGAYFPGYRVSWVGAFVGFVYAFVVGYAVGRVAATLYNRFTPR